MTEADLTSLPDPSDALQVQQQENAADSGAATPAVEDQGGSLVDALGNAQAATTEEERQAALVQLVESIIAVDPTFFDDATVVSANPN